MWPPPGRNNPYHRYRPPHPLAALGDTPAGVSRPLAMPAARHDAASARGTAPDETMLRYQLNAAATAAQFLTRLPVPGGMNRPDPDPTLLRAAVVYFPLVGGLVGAVTGAVAWAAGLGWPSAVAVALALAAEAVLTGAFHEDAVADACDAFGGGWTRDDILRILADSRVGSYGAAGLFFALVVRWAALTAVPADRLVAVAAASGAVGRWAILVVMAAVPPVPGRDGLAKDVGQRIGWTELLAGSLLTAPGLAVCGWLDPLRSAAGVAAAGLLAVGWGGYVRRRIGGVTGDGLGAGCYLGQLGFLLAATAGTGR